MGILNDPEAGRYFQSPEEQIVVIPPEPEPTVVYNSGVALLYLGQLTGNSKFRVPAGTVIEAIGESAGGRGWVIVIRLPEGAGPVEIGELTAQGSFVPSEELRA